MLRSNKHQLNFSKKAFSFPVFALVLPCIDKHYKESIDGGNSPGKIQINRYKGTRILMESSCQPQLPVQKTLEVARKKAQSKQKKQLLRKNTAEDSPEGKGNPHSPLCNQTLSLEG